MLTLKELAKATGGDLIRHEPREIEGFSIDSRNLTKGEFFIPLPGSRTDGHRFLREAFEKGASGAFVRSRDFVEPAFSNIVLVENTETALLKAAESYRASFEVPIVGITGSWGKTTTKELITSILSVSGTVHKTPGNYNTEYGLPLSLLEMEEDVLYGVFELGLQYPGDVETLSEVLSPTIGLITGVGRVHAENFPSVERIAEEKLKLTKGMEPGSKVIINGDSRPLREAARSMSDYEFVEYSTDRAMGSYYSTNIDLKGIDGLNCQIDRVSDFKANIAKEKRDNFPLFLESGLNSKANVNNIIGASVIALEMGVSPLDVKKGVDINPLPQRLNPVSFPGGVLVDDTYNANPSATRNALDLIASINSSKHKYFVFGDMKELGRDARKYHRDLAPHIIEAGIDRVLAIGELTMSLVTELQSAGCNGGVTIAEWFESREILKERLSKLVRGEDNLILIKGSRSMKMEEFVDYLASS